MIENYKFAGIDIGSNAIRLIIKNVVPGENYKDAVLNKLVYLRLPLRLGGDVFTSGKISETKTDDFIKAMKIYKDLIDFYDIKQHYRACATSATRSSKNGLEVIQKIEKITGIKIDIIDGTEEAELLFKTNAYYLKDENTFLSADLGGGSLQITLFKKDKLKWTHSYQIGTVRFLNNTVQKSELKQFEQDMTEIAKKHKRLRVIGSGGNINKISKLLKAKEVKLTEIKKLHEHLTTLTYEERIRQYEFRADRADVIIPAADIYIKLLKYLNVNKIFVPQTGLADGIIRELYENNIDKN